MSQPSHITKKIDPREWELHKNRIIELWLVPSAKLKDVIRTIQEETGFIANEKQYRYQLEVWKVKKNWTTSELEYIESIWKQRDVDGKETRVKTKHGIKIPKETLKRRKARRFVSTQDTIDARLRASNGEQNLQMGVSGPDASSFDFVIGTPTTVHDTPTPSTTVGSELSQPPGDPNSPVEHISDFDSPRYHLEDELEHMDLVDTTPQPEKVPLDSSHVLNQTRLESSPAVVDLIEYEHDSISEVSPPAVIYPTYNTWESIHFFPSYRPVSFHGVQSFLRYLDDEHFLPSDLISQYRTFFSCTLTIAVGANYNIRFECNKKSIRSPHSLGWTMHEVSPYIICQIEMVVTHPQNFQLIRPLFDEPAFTWCPYTIYECCNCNGNTICLRMPVWLTLTQYRTVLAKFDNFLNGSDHDMLDPVCSTGVNTFVQECPVLVSAVQQSRYWDIIREQVPYWKLRNLPLEEDFVLLWLHVVPPGGHSDFLMVSLIRDCHMIISKLSRQEKTLLLRLTIRTGLYFEAKQLIKSLDRLDFSVLLDAIYYNMPRENYGGHEALFRLVLGSEKGTKYCRCLEGRAHEYLYLVATFLGGHAYTSQYLAPIFPDKRIMLGKDLAELADTFRHKRVPPLNIGLNVEAHGGDTPEALSSGEIWKRAMRIYEASMRRFFFGS